MLSISPNGKVGESDGFAHLGRWGNHTDWGKEKESERTEYAWILAISGKILVYDIT
jgi:hypothetical protein